MKELTVSGRRSGFGLLNSLTAVTSIDVSPHCDKKIKMYMTEQKTNK